jgi:cysteine desulfuration protein SufE
MTPGPPAFKVRGSRAEAHDYFAPMSPSANEHSLIEAFSIIDDPHERLGAIVASCAGPGIPVTERSDDDLVPGCVSRVWLIAEVENGRLRLRWEADSPLVKSLAGLVCRVYEGSDPGQAAAHETQILSGLRLDRQLSPTRLHGLEMTGRRIRSLAGKLVTASYSPNAQSAAAERM